MSHVALYTRLYKVATRHRSYHCHVNRMPSDIGAKKYVMCNIRCHVSRVRHRGSYRIAKCHGYHAFMYNMPCYSRGGEPELIIRSDRQSPVIIPIHLHVTLRVFGGTLAFPASFMESQLERQSLAAFDFGQIFRILSCPVSRSGGCVDEPSESPRASQSLPEGLPESPQRVFPAAPGPTSQPERSPQRWCSARPQPSRGSRGGRAAPAGGSLTRLDLQCIMVCWLARSVHVTRIIVS